MAGGGAYHLRWALTFGAALLSVAVRMGVRDEVSPIDALFFTGLLFFCAVMAAKHLAAFMGRD